MVVEQVLCYFVVKDEVFVIELFHSYFYCFSNCFSKIFAKIENKIGISS